MDRKENVEWKKAIKVENVSTSSWYWWCWCQFVMEIVLSKNCIPFYSYWRMIWITLGILIESCVWEKCLTWYQIQLCIKLFPVINLKIQNEILPNTRTEPKRVEPILVTPSTIFLTGIRLVLGSFSLKPPGKGTLVTAAYINLINQFQHRQTAIQVSLVREGCITTLISSWIY